MTEPIPSSRAVYDPSIGADGGGAFGGAPLATIAPVSHVDDLHDDLGGRVPAMAMLGAVSPARHELAPDPELVACPTCGGGVHPDRIRI